MDGVDTSDEPHRLLPIVVGHFLEWVGWCLAILVAGVFGEVAPTAFFIGIALGGGALVATGQRRMRSARRLALAAVLCCGSAYAAIRIPAWLAPPPPHVGEDIATASTRLGERLVPMGDVEAEAIVSGGDRAYWYLDLHVGVFRTLVVVRDGRIVSVTHNNR